MRAIVRNRGAAAFDASTTVHRFVTTLDAARDLVLVTNGIDNFEALTSTPGVTTTSSRIVLAIKHSTLDTRAQARLFRPHVIDLLVTDLDPDDPRLAAHRSTIGEAC